MWDATPGTFTRFAQHTLDLDDYINEQVYLRFLYIGGGSFNVGYAIDDISLTGTALVLSSVSPARTTVGSSITLTGSGFGAAQGTGRVRLLRLGRACRSRPRLHWSNTEIAATCGGAKSHTLPDLGADGYGHRYKRAV